MNINIHKCDKCGFEARQDNDEVSYRNFVPMSIKLSPNKYDGFSGSYARLEQSGLYCEECIKKLGFTKVNNGEPIKEDEPVKDIRDRLYDLVQELLKESNQQ